MVYRSRCSCLLCKNEMSVSGLSRHYGSKLCNKGITVSLITNRTLVPEDFICLFCQKVCKNNNSFKNHVKKCPKNNDRVYINGMVGKTSWCKGLTKETDERVRKRSLTLISKYENEDYVRKGSKHSEETKQKISKIRLKFLEENPEKVPYLLNHYSKGESFPEKYWREILEKYNINFISEYRISLYSLDFAIIDKMIDLEIDGEQHYSDNRIIKSDLKRTEYLESLGWKVIRIRWSEYQKLNFEKRQLFVDDLIKTFSGCEALN